jgi:hypothetical protein
LARIAASSAARVSGGSTGFCGCVEQAVKKFSEKSAATKRKDERERDIEVPPEIEFSRPGVPLKPAARSHLFPPRV